MIGWVPVFLVFVAEVEEQLVGSGAWPVGWSIIGVTNCIDFAGISCLRLSPSCTGCRRGRVAKWWFVITPVVFSNLMDDWRPVLASDHFYVLLKRMYAISLYHSDECIYSGSRGQIEIFCPGDLAIFGVVFFTIVYAFFVGTNYCDLFYDCNSFRSLGEVCSWGWVSSAFLKVVGLGHGVEHYCWPVTVVTVFL